MSHIHFLRSDSRICQFTVASLVSHILSFLCTKPSIGGVSYYLSLLYVMNCRYITMNEMRYS
jgi:hypothetical protein